MKKDFNSIRFYYFFGLLVLFALLFLWMIAPFFNAIVWASVLAWFFYPLFNFLKKHIVPNKHLASVLTIFLIILIVLIPLVGISSLILQQTIALYHSTEKDVGKIIDQVRVSLFNYGDYSIVKLFDDMGFNVQSQVTQLVKFVSQFITQQIGNLTQGTIRVFVLLLIVIYALYYFFQDGERILKLLLRISPLDNKSDELIYQRLVSTLRATFKGSILVALIQGGIAGLIFWIAGVASPLFWALIMVVMAVLPAVGPSLLALPAGIILLLMGNIWQGIFMLVFGFGFVSIIDNLLRPLFVGKDTEIHPLLIFFSILGGLLVFGATGFIIGPVVISVLTTLWSMYENQYKKDLGK
ncbi:MAG: putative permease [Parcubacteria group bacterium GW2011_GWA2_38_13]|nr:MAG: putative permease [Parcubacteria group bacterium GW2011_GWA2_38_13]